MRQLSADDPTQEVRVKLNELYEKVTNNIVSEIEKGNLPPWLKRMKARPSFASTEPPPVLRETALAA